VSQLSLPVKRNTNVKRENSRMNPTILNWNLKHLDYPITIEIDRQVDR
jgi:hypothetical protein